MKTLTNIALISMLASPALAGGPVIPAEEPYIEPVVETQQRADGNWGGFYAGGQLGYGDLNGTGTTLDGNGALGGVHAGYRMDYGQYVMGAELAYNASKIDLATAGDELDRIARLKLIGGYDLGRTLVYGSVGAAHAKATVGGASLSDTGYTVGIGADYALTDQWTIGAEVMHDKFDNFDNSGTDLSGTSAQLKVGFRF